MAGNRRHLPAIAREAGRCWQNLRSRENLHAQSVAAVASARRTSAMNLAHYLCYREESERLEGLLAEAGLAPALAPLSVLRDLESILALCGEHPRGRTGVLARKEAEALLDRRTGALLGPRIGQRRIRYIVNAPESAVGSAGPLAEILAAGVSVVRINCARGDQNDWLRIIANLRAAEKKTGRSCRVFMDLAGPKVRTAAVERRRGGGKPARVRMGDRFLLTGDAHGQGAKTPLRMADGAPRIPGPAPRMAVRIALTQPGVLGGIEPGHPVLIDDGKIVARVLRVGRGWAEAEVVDVREKGQKLRAERSVNVPLSRLQFPEITAKDERDLALAAMHADMVGLSFVRGPEHVAQVAARLREMGAKRAGIVLKVENREAVQNLPLLLFEALKRDRVGVLIARGDLAAECGFASLALLQKECAALAHAAHLPVILATQVMEQMVREGMPSRSEMGDLAFADGLESLLFNRGKHVAKTMRFLETVVHSARVTGW